MLDQNERAEIVIQGVTTSGKLFRPSDWAERIAGVLSTYGKDHRMIYSPHVKPVTLDGVKCVIADRKLAEADPRAWNFLLNFARENDLQILDNSRAGTPNPSP